MDKVLKAIIKSDIYRHYGSFKKPVFWKIHNPSLNYQIIFRKAHFYNCVKNNKFLAVLYRYKLNKLSRRMQLQIPFPTKIGTGLNIVHYGRIIISPFASIGNNCNIFTGVTIGSATRGPKKGSPTIGNKVWIGPNAVVVGNVTIGSNVLIAANSFVNFDVPNDCVVIGNPGIIKHKENATETYICNTYDEAN